MRNGHPVEDLRRHVDKSRVTVLDRAILPRIDVAHKRYRLTPWHIPYAQGLGH